MKRGALAVAIAVLALACSAPEGARGGSASTSAVAPAPPVAIPAGVIRYLALGDSFTIGTGSSPAEAFPARLTERLEKAGKPVALKNLGVNGYTTADLEREELPQVEAFAPTLVTLAIGANDLVRGSDLASYQQRVRHILAELVRMKVAPARIVCVPQPDWARTPTGRMFGDPAELEAGIELFNKALRDEAKRVGAVWAGLDQLMKDQATQHMLARDGLHPSAKAHDAVAEALAPIVTPLLTTPP